MKGPWFFLKPLETESLLYTKACSLGLELGLQLGLQLGLRAPI